MFPEVRHSAVTSLSKLGQPHYQLGHKYVFIVSIIIIISTTNVIIVIAIINDKIWQ